MALPRLFAATILQALLACLTSVASAQSACPVRTHSGEGVDHLMAGYLPIFRSGDALPKAGIFALDLQPVVPAVADDVAVNVRVGPW